MTSRRDPGAWVAPQLVSATGAQGSGGPQLPRIRISQPEASLGNMLTEAQTYFFRNPWLVAWPGLVLVAIVMSASFLGDGLRDALDPRQR